MHSNEYFPSVIRNVTTCNQSQIFFPQLTAIAECLRERRAGAGVPG